MIRLNTSLQFSIILCLLPLIMATVSYFWQPFDVTELNISNRLKPMSLTHPLGTDHFGRDMLSMIMVGARTSIAVAFVAVGIGVLFGVPLGLFAATWRGSFIDDSVMRFNDLIFAFPSLVIAILITAIAGPSAFNAIIAIGVFNIPVFARVSRGAALSLWQREFILSARVAGKTGLRISIEHILPNLMHILIAVSYTHLKLPTTPYV